jgi:hypothetical protein
MVSWSCLAVHVMVPWTWMASKGRMAKRLSAVWGISILWLCVHSAEQEEGEERGRHASLEGRRGGTGLPWPASKKEDRRPYYGRRPRGQVGLGPDGCDPLVSHDWLSVL